MTRVGDRFLNEVNEIHAVRERMEHLEDPELDALSERLGDNFTTDWTFAARDAQLPPRDLDWCWLFLAGRGSGKSHSMSCAIHMAVRAGIKRIHLVAPTTADLHDVNLDGPSGILKTAGADPVPKWVGYKRRLEWS